MASTYGGSAGSFGSSVSALIREWSKYSGVAVTGGAEEAIVSGIAGIAATAVQSGEFSAEEIFEASFRLLPEFLEEIRGGGVDPIQEGDVRLAASAFLSARCRCWPQ